MKAYVCGNPLIPEDSLPMRIIVELRKRLPSVAFIEFDPTEELPKERELIIIDTVMGAKDVMLLRDIDAFLDAKALSPHDFDLGMSLKLAKKMGKLHSVRVIGVPPEMEEEEAVEKVSGFIASLS